VVHRNDNITITFAFAAIQRKLIKERLTVLNAAWKFTFFLHDNRRYSVVGPVQHWQTLTRKPCCRMETARCRCKFWSISTASWAKAEWI